MIKCDGLTAQFKLNKLWKIEKSFYSGLLFPILSTIGGYRDETRGKNVLQTEQKKGKNSTKILFVHRISQFKTSFSSQLITYLKF